MVQDRVLRLLIQQKEKETIIQPDFLDLKIPMIMFTINII